MIGNDWYPMAPFWRCNGVSSRTSEELVEILLRMERGVVILEGASGCGKTRLLHMVRDRSQRTMGLYSYQDVVGELLNLYHKGEPAREKMQALMGAYSILAVEDMDYLRGKFFTQATLGKIIQEASGNMLLILTGNDLRREIPDLLEELDAPVCYTAGEIW